MAESITRGERATVIESVLNDLDAPYHILDPSAATLSLLSATDLADTADEGVVAADEDALKTVRDDFKQATALADLVDSGLTLVTQATSPEATTIVGDDAYVLLAATGDTVTAVSCDEGVEDFRDFGTTQAEEGEEFSLRKPGITRIRETAAGTFNESFVESFDAALSGVGEFPETSNVDGVTLLIILAARHEQLLYDLGKWGEDIGLASKATFSRTKTNLEDHGLIDTEKVPIDVGRPRLRLLPGTDDVASVDDEALIEYLINELED